MKWHSHNWLNSVIKTHLTVIGLAALIAVIFFRRRAEIGFGLFNIWLGILLLWIIYWFKGGSVLLRTCWFLMFLLFWNVFLNWRDWGTLGAWIMNLTQVFIQTITYWLGLWILREVKKNIIAGVYRPKIQTFFRKTWPVDLACIQFLIFLTSMISIGLLGLIYHPVDDMPGDAIAAFYVLGPWSLVILLGVTYSMTIALPIGLVFSVIGWRYGWLLVPSILLVIRLIQSKEIDKILQIQNKMDITEAIIFSLGVLWASYRWFWKIRKEWASGIQKSF